MTNILLMVLLVVSLVAIILQIVLLTKKQNTNQLDEKFAKLQADFNNEFRATRKETNEAIGKALNDFSERHSSNAVQVASAQEMRLRALQTDITQQMTNVNQRFADNAVQTEQKLENIRSTIEKRITSLQEENTKSINQMRETVDEKLQKTLDEKLNQSFSLVSERLEQVYKGLGEMQNLAVGVGDLKKVLSNVKTRGILGEIQLGAILEDILSKSQYEENFSTRPNSSERVEFAIKLPGDGETPVYLPIDAKFPSDAYTQLIDAYDTGDALAVATASKLLESRIRAFAKDIHTKYVEVPYTTEFAILFLPTEGLYSEVVKLGMIEKLQSEFKINIAGPTTMAALLNSLQMGFKTLAIQKRSSEVWNVLGGVKSEFDKFAKALSQTQQRLRQADKELEDLIGTRTRQIQRKLSKVQSLPSGELEEESALLPENE